MKKLIFCFFFSCCFFFSFSDQLSDTADKETVSNHLDSLNLISSFDFQNNEVVMAKINNYLFKEKKLLTKMLSLSKYSWSPAQCPSAHQQNPKVAKSTSAQVAGANTTKWWVLRGGGDGKSHLPP